MEEFAVIHRSREIQGLPINYGPFFNALQMYRQTAMSTARKLQKLAKQLHTEKEKWMAIRKKACQVRGGGSALAAGAMATGLFLSAPFIFPAILLGTAVTVGGQLTASNADRVDKNTQTGFLKRIELLFKDFEEDVKKVEEAARNLVGVDATTDINIIERLLDMISTDIEFVGVENAPRLSRLREELRRMSELLEGCTVQSMYHFKDYLQNAWHFAAPLLSFEGTFDPGCDHSLLMRCTNSPPKKSHYECYSTGGKFVYMLGITCNVALFTASAVEASKLDKVLTKMSSAGTDDEKIEIMGGLVDSIYSKGKEMEQRVRLIFGEENLELL